MTTGELVSKREDIKYTLINMLSAITMDIPSNFEEIIQFVFEDVCETADQKDWSVGDVVIGFRRWIESKSE